MERLVMCFSKSRVGVRILACLISGILLSQQSIPVRKYAVPNHGSLGLSVPMTFTVSTQNLAEPPSLILQIRPSTGNAFGAKVTAVWLEPSNINRTTPGAIRMITQNAGNNLLSTALENSITIQEMSGPQMVGAYFTLTDRDPKPGEFKYLTQGTYSTGELLGAFTIVSNAPNSPELSQILQMLKTATYSGSNRPVIPGITK